MWSWLKVDPTGDNELQHLLSPHLLTLHPHHQLHIVTVRYGYSHPLSVLADRYTTWAIATGQQRPISLWYYRSAVASQTNFHIHTPTQSVHSPNTNGTDDIAILWYDHGCVVGIDRRAPVWDEVESPVRFPMDFKTERRGDRVRCWCCSVVQRDCEQWVSNDAVIA